MVTAFVLTGGGSLGAVQVGMLTALHEHGIEPDLLVGTSVGAVNAAYLGGPGTTEERLRSLARLWRGMRRQDIFAVEPRRWLAAARGVAPSLFSGLGLERLLERHLGYESLDDARIPVVVTATELVTGRGVIIKHGPVGRAVRASAAVPGVLPPVLHQGRTLVDGAIGELDLLGRTAAHGATDLFLLPAGYPCAGGGSPSALGAAMTALSLLLHRQLAAEVRGYSGPARLHLVPPLCPLAVSPADFSQTPALMSRAHASTSLWLERAQERDDASVLRLHTHRTPALPPDHPASPTPVVPSAEAHRQEESIS
jgi:NTE family protein